MYIEQKDGFHYLNNKRLWDMSKQELMDTVVRFDAKIAMCVYVNENRMSYKIEKYLTAFISGMKINVRRLCVWRKWETD